MAPGCHLPISFNNILAVARNPWAVTSSFPNPRRRRAAFRVLSVMGRSAVRILGKKIFPFPSDRLQLSQHLQDLLLEWHLVSPPHLRLLRWNGPDGGFEVELAPLGHAEFAKSGKHMREHLKSASYRRLPVMSVNGTKEPPERLGF